MPRYIKSRVGFATKVRPFSSKISKPVKDALIKEAKKRYGEHFTPARLKKFVEAAIARAAKGKSGTAARIMETIGAGLAVELVGGVVKLLPPPIAGVVGSKNKKIR